MWYVQGNLNSRNPYAQAVQNLATKMLELLNQHIGEEATFNHTERDWKYKIALVYVPAVDSAPHLRLARLVDNENDLMKCAIALGGTPFTGHAVELTGVGIPLYWADDTPAA